MEIESKKDTTASGAAPAPSGRRRGPGRPPLASRAPVGREQLLEAALELFARQGIAETPLAAVAAAVGVSKAMLHYHFKTREHLLDVIVQERLLPLRRMMEARLEDREDPASRLLELARQMVQQASRHAWLAPLWIREVLSEGGLLRERMHLLLGEPGPSVLPWARWQAEGRLHPGLKPELLVISVLGLAMLPLAVSPRPCDALSRRPDEATLLAHVTALLQHGLSA